MSHIESIFQEAKGMGMDDIQAKALTFIIASALAEELGNVKAYNHFEMRLAELGVV